MEESGLNDTFETPSSDIGEEDADEISDINGTSVAMFQSIPMDFKQASTDFLMHKIFI